MKTLLFISCFVLSISCFAQDSFSDAAARKIIDTFFEGFHKGDTTLLTSVMTNGVMMQVAYEDKEGNNKLSNGTARELVNAIVSRPKDQKWEERLLKYVVQRDGNLAHVWTPYEFWLNDKFSHCGANSFTLALTKEGWKIVHLIDSRRKEGCR